VTLLSLVPTMLIRMLDCGWSAPDHVRVVLLGGAPASRPLLERAARSDVATVVTYGMTETCSQLCTQIPGSPIQEAGHIGPPVPGAEVCVRAGRIHVRGPMLLRGYLQDRDGQLALRDPTDDRGWLDTGDAGRVDERGHLHVLGRADDMIISGGENVHPRTVERVLLDHPAIAAACVYAVPDATWGQLVACAVVVTPRSSSSAHWVALNRDELAQFLAERLPTHSRPRRLAVLEQLSVGPTGKIARQQTALRAQQCSVPLAYSDRAILAR
ncbi:MAG: AMP-binding protein, partial [Myxococcota bacterium]